MKFRDYDVEIPKPYHNGKQWIYDDTPTYQNLLDCFLETQRPEGEKKIREQYGNTRLRAPFRKINKMDLQLAFDHVEGREGHAYEVDWVENNDGKIVACILYYNMKNMKTQFKKIKSFTGAEYKFAELSFNLLAARSNLFTFHISSWSEKANKSEKNDNQ